MASLTSNIGSSSSGKPIIQPGPVAPSILGSIAQFAANAVPGLSRLADGATATRNARIQDEAAGAIFGIQTGGGASTAPAAAPEYVNSGPVAIDGSLEGAPIPQDAQSAANDAIRARRGVQQGKINQATYDLQLEQLQAEMFQKYPDQRAELAAYFQGRGLDHYMFRAFNGAKTQADNEEAQKMGAINTQFQYAAARGLVTDQTDLHAGAEIGRRAMEAAAQADAAKSRAEEVRANKELSLKEREAALKTNGQDMGAAVISQAANSVQPLLDNFGLAFSAAGSDAERQTMLADTSTKAKAALLSYKGHGIAELSAAGASEETRKQFTDYMDSQISAVDNIFTTSFKANTSAINNLTASFGITAAQAAPMYSRVVSLVGQQQANALFGENGMMQLAPEVVESVKKELANVDPTSARGTVSLARALSYMRGDLKLPDLTAAEAVPYVNMARRGALASQTAINGGDTTQIQPWMNAFGGVAEAVAEFAPTTTRWDSLHSATTVLATSGARNALSAAIRQDPEYGTALAQASRAGSAKIIMTARNLPATNSGPFMVEYDEGSGRFTSRLSRSNYDLWAARQTTSFMRPGPDGPVMVQGREVPSYEETLRSPPAEVRTRLDILNTNLDNLIETDKYDPAIPATLQPKERRALYALGRTPESMRVRDGAANPTQASEFDRLKSNLDTSIQQLLGGTAAAPIPQSQVALRNQVAARAEAIGVPVDVAHRIASIESRWNVNAENPKTKARGLFQINDDRTNRNLEENINDGLDFVKNGIKDARNALGREPQGWEVYVAHQQGPGGGPALLNPANSARKAVDVLAPLYPNRGVAASAVTGNGGSADMTVAEFLNVIKRFYERG